jgi:large repetitive protein
MRDRGAIRRLCISLVLGFFFTIGVSTPSSAADQTFTYDALGRLTRVEDATGKAVVYTYDPAGNRSSVAYGGANGAPVAAPDNVSTNAHNALTFDPRNNDSDPDGDPLTIVSNTPAAHGAVAINSGQTLTYTPNAGFSGSDSFTYTISDGHSHQATGTVAMTVVNHPPVATNDAIATAYQTAKNFDPRQNDYDPDGEPLTITGKTNPSHGTLSITGGGMGLTYTPAAGFSGGDSFTYTISDGDTGTATATVAATVTQQNGPPVANDVSVRFVRTLVPPATVQPIVPLDPRSNDSDPDGDPLTITQVGVPTSGQASVTINGGGTSLTYSYNSAVSNLHLTDTFTYTISDGQGHTATATVTVTIKVSTGS